MQKLRNFSVSKLSWYTVYVISKGDQMSYGYMYIHVYIYGHILEITGKYCIAGKFWSGKIFASLANRN